MAASGSSAKELLQSTPAGNALVQLVETRLAHEPKLQQEFYAVGQQLAEESKGNNGPAGGKENRPGPMVPATSAEDLTAQAVVVIKDINFVSPRGKFDVAFLLGRIAIFNAKQPPIIISVDDISTAAILDSLPSDPKKNKVLLFVGVSRSSGADEVLNKQKLGTCGVIMQSVSTESLAVTASTGEELSGQAAVVLCTALGKAGVTAFTSPEPDFYVSSKGAAAIQANVRVNSGWLFPLRGALLFIEKPALLEPLHTITSVEFNRMQSPTFDVVLRRSGGLAPLEFSQIDRAELSRLQEYFRKSKVKTHHEVLAAAAAASASGAGAYGAATAAGSGSAAGGPGPASSSSAAKDMLGGGSAAATAACGRDAGVRVSDADAAAMAAAMEEDDSDEEDSDFDPEAEMGRRQAKRPRYDPSAPGTSRARPAQDEEDEEASMDGSEEEDEESDGEDDSDLDLTDEEDVKVTAVKRAAVLQAARGAAAQQVVEEEEEEESEDDDYEDDE